MFHRQFTRLTVILGIIVAATLPATVQAQTAQPPRHIVLADGDTCQYANGASFVVGDERANYACVDGRWLLGDVYVRGNGSAQMIAIHMDEDGNPELDSIVSLDHWN